jgi:hypothetical protein
MVLGASLANYFEPRDLWLVQINFGRHLYKVSMPCYEHMREWGSEVSSIKIGGCLNTASSSFVISPFLDHVNFFALRTVNFDTAAPQLFTKAHRDAFLVIAKCSGASAKHSFQVFSC